jgi:hypothetical protein
VLETEFERKCQYVHIRALLASKKGHFEQAKQALRLILHEASTKEPSVVNRELLWIRITLADLLRECGESDEAIVLFSDLVTRIGSEEKSHSVKNSALDDEPEPPARLALAEKALRLVKDTKKKEAKILLSKNGLRWKRKQDFWVITGGPVVDTASIAGVWFSETSLGLVLELSDNDSACAS